jgi:hypothetical protein
MAGASTVHIPDDHLFAESLREDQNSPDDNLVRFLLLQWLVCKLSSCAWMLQWKEEMSLCSDHLLLPSFPNVLANDGYDQLVTVAGCRV